ncbi:hypothetical protein N7466_005802 [Penicillium verhagenii]|uniref:uncharacterized protein n=1 Tax=Penicillium verhagenii TaxID=1562060 RepID=UPI00254567C6|nr:uncharacterized protein N7466_005802 [Penicillium verhagenii]KAJ5930309.1 hypothetical protein N7466_005802 [Penicillium verhagenii]
MVVCTFFQQGRCKFGDRCKFEHPGQGTAGSSGNRFGALAAGGFGSQGSRQNNQPAESYNLNAKDIKLDLTAGEGRPQWIFSAYAPLKDLPRQLFGGDRREQSMEEMRLRHYQAAAAGNANQALQEAEALYHESVKQMEDALNDPNGAIQYIIQGGKEHPNRIDIVNGNTGSNVNQAQSAGQTFGQPSVPAPANAFGSATPAPFGQPSPFGKPTSSLGQPSAFGQPSTLGQNPSPFGQPSAIGGQTAFGKPGFGQPELTQPVTNQPTFGQSGFGQPTAPAAPFGGAPASASPFGVVNQNANPSPFAAARQNPNPSPFGAVNQNPNPSPFGAVKQNPNPSPFGVVNQNANPSPFGQPAAQQPAAPSPFGQPSGTAGTFGQPSQNPSPFGQPQQANTQNPFGQPAATASPFGAPQATAAPFGQPAAPQGLPVASLDAGPPAYMQADDPKTLNPLPRLQGETRRDPVSNKLTMWKGQPVQYVNNGYPCYQHPQDPKTLARINFPDGPPDAATLRDSQGKDDEYTPEVVEMYQFFLINGYFKDGIVPAVPPKREWISFDF